MFDITQEGLERGTVSGGTGYWSTPWELEGQAFILRFAGKGPPRTGRFHLLLRGKHGDARRSLNLTRETDVRLQFWARVHSFEAEDQAEAMVCWSRCDDESSWTVVARWADGDDDDVYRLHTFRLTRDMLTRQFTIRFRTRTADSDDWLFIDDISLVSPRPAPTFTPVPTPTPIAPPAPERVFTKIRDFTMQTLRVRVGTIVTWINRDPNDIPNGGHNVISSTGEWRPSPILAQGNSFSFPFNKEGTFHYFCSLHPPAANPEKYAGMEADIIVTP